MWHQSNQYIYYVVKTFEFLQATNVKNFKIQAQLYHVQPILEIYPKNFYYYNKSMQLFGQNLRTKAFV